MKGRIPLWVALAGMLVALMIAVVIMARVLEPLSNLVFPDEATAPVPDGAVELEYKEESRFNDGEWLYGTNQTGCEVVAFYLSNDTTCRVTPLACDPDREVSDVTSTAGGIQSIATCEGTHEAVAASYSWMVDISSGYEDYETKFRVYLFKERR